MEEARTRLFDELSYGGRTDEWHFILASTKCDFIRQAFFGRRLRVETNVSRIGNKSFQCIHRIMEEETGRLIAIGEAAVVHFNFQTQTSEPLPDDLQTMLAEYLAPSVGETISPLSCKKRSKKGSGISSACTADFSFSTFPRFFGPNHRRQHTL
ncbi:hypothetical protein GS8_1195 [Geobacillus stearothermophilus]|uniref:Thioesterase domain-containing protein n=1 Tax=Geobacillus stearothermophilus TaxID=1422 RepID=A0A150N5W4_GEOSE|nr:hypothetical protein GS8_1195 [Geobacillus stearothermophilus]KYD32093.1 hypothetical protein B4114_1470 [Geobacillus stearothermophilus]